MSSILKLGDKGPAVSALQTQLNAAGFPVVAVDGIFGVSTLAAVKAFQTSKGLVSDGVVGPATEPALNGVVPSPAPVPAPTPSTTQQHGIDVSAAQVHTDWGLVAEAGISFAFMKATEGYSYVNPYFATDWRAAKAAGVLRGAYHFFRPGDDGLQQAIHFLNVLGTNTAGMLLPVVDWEVSDGVSAAGQKAGVKAFCDHVKSVLGVTPILYYSASWPAGLGDMSEFSKSPKWVAEYGPRCRIPFDIWQYSETGTVNGVKGKVDKDVFDGSLEQFVARIGSGL